MLDEFGQCVSGPEECTRKFPYTLDDHGWYCGKCSETECTEYLEAACNETNQVYNGASQKCVPCTEEFGALTLSCGNGGATECAAGAFLQAKEAAGGLSNQHCLSCSDAIANCSLCSTGDKCQQCQKDFVLADDGQCLQSEQLCNKKFPY